MDIVVSVMNLRFQKNMTFMSCQLLKKDRVLWGRSVGCYADMNIFEIPVLIWLNLK
jgi:hypothetical protein